MSDPLLIAESDHPLTLLPGMANRHGLVAGATGTGKTVTLQVMAESLQPHRRSRFRRRCEGRSFRHQPARRGQSQNRRTIQEAGVHNFSFTGCPVTSGMFSASRAIPSAPQFPKWVRCFLAACSTSMTPRAASFRWFQSRRRKALLLLDLKDLQAMLQYVGDNAKDFQSAYGNISSASIGAIQRGLLPSSSRAADKFLGEPALNLDDLMQTDSNGHGVINILAADKLIQSPKLYATFLLWLLTELFENFPKWAIPKSPSWSSSSTRRTALRRSSYGIGTRSSRSSG